MGQIYYLFPLTLRKELFESCEQVRQLAVGYYHRNGQYNENQTDSFTTSELFAKDGDSEKNSGGGFERA